MPYSDSHLSSTQINNGILDLYNPSFTVDFTNASEHAIKQGHHRRPDLLAHELYGNSRLWWVFAMYNKNTIRDPINDFTHGKLIMVPSREAVAGT